MSFLNKIFGNKSQDEESVSYIIATLNDKIMPIDRGDVYEDPLDELLSELGVGEVSGGGTMQHETGEIDFCDVEIQIKAGQLSPELLQTIIAKLEGLGAPKGSKLTVERTDEVIPFGVKEGLGLYLDGVNLPKEVYENQDTDALIEELLRCMNLSEDYVLRYWNGPQDTGLYFYADSFEQMKQSIAALIGTHPECQNCRVEQVA